MVFVFDAKREDLAKLLYTNDKTVLIVDEDLTIYTNESVKRLPEDAEVEGVVWCG